MKGKEPLVLLSAEPINDGGRKYNWIYVVCAISVGVIFLGDQVSFQFFIFGALVGMCMGWIIKDCILRWQSAKLRDIMFVVNNKIAYSELINGLIPQLTPLGMSIEKSSDREGCPVISYKGIIYDVFYNEDNTFTIWWRKSIAKACFTRNHIKMFRQIVIAIGIIGYNTQQVCDNLGSNNSRGIIGETSNDSIIICPCCGKKNSEMAKFCISCGNSIPRGDLLCGNCNAPLDQGEKFCSSCGVEVLYQE